MTTDEAAAREIEWLTAELKRMQARYDEAAELSHEWRNKFEASERQRKQISEYIETLAKGGIEAAVGAGK